MQLKGKAMIAEEIPPAFPLAGAVKDTELIADARARRRHDAADGVLAAVAEAADAGHGDEDLAAIRKL